MLVIDAAQAEFVAGVVMFDAERRILFCELGERAGEADIVLPVGGANGDFGVAGRKADFEVGRDGALRQPLASLQLIGFADGDDVAIGSFRDLRGLFALDREKRTKTNGVVPALELGSLGDFTAEYASQSEAADRAAVVDFEGIERRVAHRETAGRRLGPRS